ncbi:phosphate ABC transporter permease subunit PstC [Candidatus Arthromitus sp. SFB-turkey]|uniref:phosphate ABC transporter permease subunit PstC n=1 Tax=Candidatus Arthromitus sp. SFB-turkey TaxID=1840217 RepID=UPI0007F45963|nr:phosphate ABC transporter permease subunit PstC [Candidatus Arthromitus sp. SFB-turkey]OAT87611.1 phosphate ABC transporter permease subunit PstC [Candidatus Arthromitus sp. SFB-turkey]HJC99727.1 phosphate ABC transporter permease subunit PstC [Candidatus Dwaynia gallinarum]
MKEKIIEFLLKIFAMISILITISIVVLLLFEAKDFFKEVSFVELFKGNSWNPLLSNPSYNIMTLIAGTLIIALIACIIAVPLGLLIAIYLSEYATRKIRGFLKPILEVLAFIPSVVYGFFALTFITPFLRTFIHNLEIYNALSAGIAIGIMVIPMIASLSEDALRSVPGSIRRGAYALGSTKYEVTTKVLIPAAKSGIISSFILAVSRAIGETMIVAIASGSNPLFNLNPLKSVQTLTAYMANVSMGDVSYSSVEYKTIFVCGAVLFFITLVLNIIARKIINKNKYNF